MIQLTLVNVEVKVGVTNDGTRQRVLTLIDHQSGISVVVPFDPLIAAKVGATLCEGVVDANGNLAV